MISQSLGFVKKTTLGLYFALKEFAQGEKGHVPLSLYFFISFLSLVEISIAVFISGIRGASNLSSAVLKTWKPARQDLRRIYALRHNSSALRTDDEITSGRGFEGVVPRSETKNAREFARRATSINNVMKNNRPKYRRVGYHGKQRIKQDRRVK